MSDLSDQELTQHLNRQTSKIEWSELERYYAQGVVHLIDGELDLIEVARNIIQDNAEFVKQHLEAGRIRQATEAEAQAWHDDNTLLWAVVAAPYVLIQCPQPDTQSHTNSTTLN
ncbi:MAG: DUF2288 domain-containing protein [Pseudomonadota bacterium]